MKNPKVWLLEPNRYSYRVVFNFVDPAGKLLKTKTWQVQKESAEPSKVMLLQANATMADKARKPEMKELAPNYMEITTVLSAIEGELVPKVVTGFATRDQINERLAEYPLTMALVVKNSGLHFSLHIATKLDE